MSMGEEQKLKLYKKHEEKKIVQRMLENFMEEVRNEDGGIVDGKRFNQEIRFSNRKNRQVENYK